MKRKTSNVLFVIAAILISACASTANLSQQGKVTLYADEVVRDLGLLQSSFIEANSAGLASTEDTRTVVIAVKSLVTAIHEVPNGWRNTVSEGLVELDHLLSTKGKVQARSYIATIQTILALF